MGLLANLLRLWRDREDPELAKQKFGHVVRFSGYDPSKQSAARRRAIDKAAELRRIADGYGPNTADVVSIRRAK